jgi:hypothetical protein
MDGLSDAPQPEQAEPPGDAHPASRRARPTARRSVVHWIVVPAILGSLTGILVVVVPWSRYVLVFAVVVSGLAWLLRVSSDWVVERAGPQRGVVLIGSVLFGSWLMMAIAPPGPLRSLGLSPIRTTREDKDPYALPPAGSRSVIPNLKEPGEAIDAVKPLRDLVMPEPTYEPPAPQTPPVDGRRGTAHIALRLSSSQSTFGEGVVLVAEAGGDGRAVHGTIAFVADGKVVDQRALRVQGAASQIEFRLVGLAPGTHTLQARYSGSRIFGAADSPAVTHLVVRR